MTIPIDAVDKEDWDRMDKGLPPRPKPKVVIPEPKLPKIDNWLHFDKIPIEKVIRIEAIRKHSVRNEDGVIFIGFDIIIQIKDQKSLSGWMIEGDLYRLLPFVREATDEAILSNVGWR